MKRLLCLSMVALLGLAGCGGSTPTYTLTGTLRTAIEGTDYALRGPCLASGYADIPAGGGGQITVKDGNGKVLAIGTLGPGKAPTTIATFTSGCAFKFSIPKVPQAAFYEVDPAGESGTNFSLAQMKADSWNVSITLGSGVPD